MGLDVLIVGRGGGSIEDLWAFNEECVARAIFDCQTPVISAVGHETDVTIADYAADLRAPTPSAAAELAVFDYRQFEEQIGHARQRLNRLMGQALERRRFRLEQGRMKLRLYSPQRQVDERRQRLADLESRLGEIAGERTAACRQRVKDCRSFLERQMERSLREGKHRLALDAGRLDALSPLKKLGGGYGYVTDEADRRIVSVAQIDVGTRIRVRLRDGCLKARVEEAKGGDSFAQKEDGRGEGDPHSTGGEPRH